MMNNINEIEKQMNKYIAQFKHLSKDEAQKEAKQSLIRSGVLTKRGNYKKDICTIK